MYHVNSQVMQDGIWERGSGGQITGTQKSLVAPTSVLNIPGGKQI